MTAFSHPLGLSRFEWQVFAQCNFALTQTPTGDFLTGPKHKKAALRMVEKGYLTKAEEQIMTLGCDKAWGVVVRLTQANCDKYNADLLAAMKGKAND
jgi:hypothetical protein